MFCVVWIVRLVELIVLMIDLLCWDIIVLLNSTHTLLLDVCLIVGVFWLI